MKVVASPLCNECIHKSNSVFCDISAKNTFTHSFTNSFLRFKSGEVLVEAGHKPNGVYLVFNGKVKLYCKNSYGEPSVLSIVQSGSIIGYRAVLSQEELTYSAEAIVDTFVCFMPKELFLSIVRVDPSSTLKLFQLLSEELKTLESKYVDSVNKTVLEKVAMAILHLVESFGFEKDNKTVNIHMSRAELAGLVGSTRESVTRSLYKLQTLRLIQLQKRTFLVLDKKSLAELAYQHIM